MPEITPLGWFHTALGIIALVSGVMALVKHKEIALWDRAGQVYLLATLVTAATALFIFNFNGEFGPGHLLAILTLGALVVGTVASVTTLFGKLSRYIRALSYTSTLLFHCIPAVTDASLRLPPGNPMATSLEDPIIRIAYLVLLVTYLIIITLQLRYIHNARKF